MKVSELVSSAIGNMLSNIETWGGILYHTKMYGAKGDGITDDTAAIQAAINDAISKNGKLVYFSPGSYKVTSLTDTDKVYFVGDNAAFVGINDVIYQFGFVGNPGNGLFYNVKDYGAKGDGVTDDADNVEYAIAEASVNGGVVYFPPGMYVIGSNITFPSNVTAEFSNGAKLNINAGITVTFNGPINAGLYQIFSGSGTVSGSIKVPFVVPQWWGAKGDGVTDDTAAIRNAAKIIIENGGILFFPTGQYLIGDPVVGWNNSGLTISNALKQFEISGLNATIIGTNHENTVIAIENSSNFKIENINIKHQSTPYRTNGYGLRIYQCSNFEINNLNISDVSAGGITLYESSFGKIINNTIINNLADGIHMTQKCNRLVVSNNMLNNNGDDQIAVVSYLSNGDVCKNIEINNNNCYHGKSRGIAIVGGSNIIILGNIIDSTKNAGIYVYRESGTNNTFTCTDVIISKNIIVDANTYDNPTLTYSSIHVGNATGLVSDNIVNITLSDNIIRRGRSHSISLNGVKEGFVYDNKIYGLDTTDITSSGININNTINIILKRNYITNTKDYGIYVENNCSGHVDVSENIIEDVNKGNTSNIDGINVRVAGSFVNFNVILDNSNRLERPIDATLINGGSFFGNKVYKWCPRPSDLILDTSWNNRSMGSGAPNTGTWKLGDIVYNTNPSAGGYIGWVCVAGGTPGTWKGFGAIQT